MEEFLLYNGDLKITYEITDEKKNKIINKIIEYVKKNDCTDGEHLFQDDNCLLDAPELVSDLLDVFEFNSEWID